VRSLPRAAASELLPRFLLCHADAPAPLGSRQHVPCCRPPSERLAGPLTFVTAFGLRRVPYVQPGLCVSRAPPTHPRLSRGRACASRIARTCIARLPASRCGRLSPNFCNGDGLRHPLCPTRPLRLTSAAIAPASTLCMHLCPGSRTDLPALPDSSPAPRSEPHCNILPPYCSAAGPGSETRQPEPLASHALLHGVRSCTSSPELPPVAYEIDAVAPTLFGCCQRRWSVGSGGAENTNWRTQVFRAILERQCVLESERGSACLTRETRKQRGVVGVRLGPP
jgi:hypothetical protein